jgi:DNA-directed RNA polymerase subunit K/omega
MDEANDLIDHNEEPATLAEPAAPITSRFLFVDVAALRAKQLRRGARPRLADRDIPHTMHKAERVAMEEVRHGLVSYDVPELKPRTESQA